MLPKYYVVFGTFRYEVVSLIINYSPVILSFLLFPVYFYVSRRNRERDKETAIYPITNHFFRVICLTHIPSYPLITSVVYLMARTGGDFSDTPITNGYCAVTILSILLVFCVTTAVCSFLIVYLALQRFLIYFFPDMGTFLAPKRTRFFVVSYLIIPFLSAASILPFMVNTLVGYQHERGLLLDVQIIPYNPFFVATAVIRILIFNVLMFLCAFLYIVMVLKIRKFKEMMSQTTVNPETYIMYQVLVLSVCQAYTFFVLFRDDTASEFISFQTFITSFGSILAVTFPCIQVTYLFCNLANLSEAIRLLECRFGSGVRPTDNRHLTAIRSTTDAS